MTERAQFVIDKGIVIQSNTAGERVILAISTPFEPTLTNRKRPNCGCQNPLQDHFRLCSL